MNVPTMGFAETMSAIASLELLEIFVKSLNMKILIQDSLYIKQHIICMEQLE